MKVIKETKDEQTLITFIPETENEKRIMGSLRNHFFFGLPEKRTYPQYKGVGISTDNFVTELRLKYTNFKRPAND